MTHDVSSDRISDFRDAWKKESRSPGFSPQHRLTLRDELSRLLDRINHKWYGTDDVVKFSEKLGSEISDLMTEDMKAAGSEHVRELPSQLPFEVNQDNGIHQKSGEVERILKENLDEEEIEEAFSGTDLDWDIIKSSLYQEIAEIDVRETKRSFEFFDRREFVEDCIGELESESFKREYRSRLVNTIRDYLTGENDTDEIEDTVAILIGDLFSSGWDEDSIEEIIESLDSEEDIGEFCELLMEESMEQTYCLPLPFDRIPDNHVNVAGVDFYSEESEEFDFLSDLVRRADEHPTLVERFRENTNLFAVLSVIAPTQELGERRMEKKLERAIDALNFGQERGVLQSPFMEPQTEYIVKYSDGTYAGRIDRHPKYGFPYDWNIDEDHFEERLEWFRFFENSPEEVTELQQRFIRSYRWYGDAIQSGIPEEELLKYMISMENMLVPEPYGKKRDLLAERLASLRGIYEKYRQGFKDQIVGLYETRNELVHSAEIGITGIEGDVEVAHRVASRMFGIIAEEEIDRFTETEELLASLENREIPEEPDDSNPFRI